MGTGRQGRWLQVTLPLAGVVLGVVLIAGPFAATVARSLLVWGPDGAAVSAGNFIGLFTDPRFAAAAINTLISGSCTTVLALMLGFTLAWLVARTDMPGRGWFETANLV
ncbi:MAG TPA: hypothetical protein VHX39_07795, partial [Acetobacteraceae bacterium]|nr:hypothetical protein [Acetobacteraceae bacterium]